MDIRVISIGTLASHPLWDERPSAATRTAHATCTLIRSGAMTLLVDPSLPEPVMSARLGERSGLSPGDVTHVFLTSFKPDVRRGLSVFDEATWWIAHAEREGVGIPLVRRLQEAAQHGDDEAREILEQDIALLQRCQPAPDRLGESIDLFPLPGVTPGLCGLLISQPDRARGAPMLGPLTPGLGSGPDEDVEGLGEDEDEFDDDEISPPARPAGVGITTLICGDAVPTVEHVERGQILHGALDVETAAESFREALEIADILVPGRDNWMINPLRRVL